MHVADHVTPEHRMTMAGDESDKRRFLRIRAVILAADGETAEALAVTLGCSRRVVRNWVAAYIHCAHPA